MNCHLSLTTDDEFLFSVAVSGPWDNSKHFTLLPDRNIVERNVSGVELWTLN